LLLLPFVFVVVFAHSHVVSVVAVASTVSALLLVVVIKPLAVVALLIHKEQNNLI